MSGSIAFENILSISVLEWLVILFGCKIKVACRVQIWKKTFCQNSNNFAYSFIKNDMFMYLLCIHKKLIILSLFIIDTLNFTIYILMNLTCPLKTCVIRSINLISMKFFSP